MRAGEGAGRQVGHIQGERVRPPIGRKEVEGEGEGEGVVSKREEGVLTSGYW